MSQQPVEPMTEREFQEAQAEGLLNEAGLGALQTGRGLLPLEAVEVQARLDGLLCRLSLSQTFVNSLDEPLEATYIFPLPDRAAVTRFRMEVADRVVEGQLRERAQAREAYDRAIEAGHRASIAEEERSGVFTVRVGNVMPGERATIRLELAGPMPYADGEVTFRFPLVVAPRYIPGNPLPGDSVGDGVVPDTDAVPDASRITPPVLLPGFPNPVRLSLEVEVFETLAVVGDLRSSLHAVIEEGRGQHPARRIRLRPGERLDRDFILRYRLGSDSVRTALSFHPDAGDSDEGTFALTVVPPVETSVKGKVKPRQVVFALDRSGSMQGWKIVAARRAVARMIETLGPRDRFAVLAFDNRIEAPPGLPADQLTQATDHHRFLAAQYLAEMEARGGTEMAPALAQAATLLEHSDKDCECWLVMVTDGQVGNEDQLLRELGPRTTGFRILTLGIDQAVNEAFLRRLAALGQGGGLVELAETEERLEQALEAIQRRLAEPVLRGLQLKSQGKALRIQPDTLVPSRPADLVCGAPVLLLGRYAGNPQNAAIALQAEIPNGEPWTQTVAGIVRDNPAIASVWARGQVRRLEDDYVIGAGDLRSLEQQIVQTSLRFGVLSRFTAFVAIDSAQKVNPGGQRHQVTQAVEAPRAWATTADAGASYMCSESPACYAFESDRATSEQLARSLSRKMLPSLARHARGSGLGDAARKLLEQALGKSTSAARPVAPEPAESVTDPTLPPALPSQPLREAANLRLIEWRQRIDRSETEMDDWLLQVSRDLDQWLQGLRQQKVDEARLARLQRVVDELWKMVSDRKASLDPGALLLLGQELELVLQALSGEPAPDTTTRRGFWK